MVLKQILYSSAPALALNAQIEKTKRRFNNYGKYGLLCGVDGLPHLMVNGDQRHWGEFITPGLLLHRGMDRVGGEEKLLDSD
ncbi:hypothetical protein F2Q70_00017913 [Brassica cretica]|uniref:Photosystem I reaction center subunit III n=1 Tax=Brassica cretica TaxID=69181 RepID=A0A8S9I5B3_BRACR|nr:hypothetical protein F2Q70_00017913 [Brassica cretica]KAF2599433.1 hypothetical protein F2Q68_00010896 [Brassica cretica]